MVILQVGNQLLKIFLYIILIWCHRVPGLACKKESSTFYHIFHFGLLSVAVGDMMTSIESGGEKPECFLLKRKEFQVECESLKL